MNPILFALALIVGCAFLWLAYVFATYGDSVRDSSPLWVPCGIIGAAVLAAAGLGIGGVLA